MAIMASRHASGQQNGPSGAAIDSPLEPFRSESELE